MLFLFLWHCSQNIVKHLANISIFCADLLRRCFFKFKVLSCKWINQVEWNNRTSSNPMWIRNVLCFFLCISWQNFFQIDLFVNFFTDTAIRHKIDRRRQKPAYLLRDSFVFNERNIWVFLYAIIKSMFNLPIKDQRFLCVTMIHSISH